MNQQKYFEAFRTIIEQMYETTVAKNSDYAESNDAFANFRQIENLTNGRISAEEGILVRMTDKLKRIASLLDKGREAKVTSEQIGDTLLDLAVYSIILKIKVENSTPKTRISITLPEILDPMDICICGHRRNEHGVLSCAICSACKHNYNTIVLSVIPTHGGKIA